LPSTPWEKACRFLLTPHSRNARRGGQATPPGGPSPSDAASGALAICRLPCCQLDLVERPSQLASQVNRNLSKKMMGDASGMALLSFGSR
jgi:hypothetical protein